MKDDVKREPQRLETSSFMRKNRCPSELDLMIVENIRKPHEVKHIPNLANLLMDHENWACKLRIDSSCAEFRVVMKKIWPFCLVRTYWIRVKQAYEAAAWSMPRSSPRRVITQQRSSECGILIPRHHVSALASLISQKSPHLKMFSTKHQRRVRLIYCAD